MAYGLNGHYLWMAGGVMIITVVASAFVSARSMNRRKQHIHERQRQTILYLDWL